MALGLVGHQGHGLGHEPFTLPAGHPGNCGAVCAVPSGGADAWGPFPGLCVHQAMQDCAPWQAAGGGPLAPAFLPGSESALFSELLFLVSCMGSLTSWQEVPRTKMMREVAAFNQCNRACGHARTTEDSCREC